MSSHFLTLSLDVFDDKNDLFGLPAQDHLDVTDKMDKHYALPQGELDIHNKSSNSFSTTQQIIVLPVLSTELQIGSDFLDIALQVCRSRA